MVARAPAWVKSYARASLGSAAGREGERRRWGRAPPRSADAAVERRREAPALGSSLLSGRCFRLRGRILALSAVVAALTGVTLLRAIALLTVTLLRSVALLSAVTLLTVAALLRSVA